MNPFKLNDLITEDFQNEIQNSFSHATGFAVKFTDAEGKHVGSNNNFCEFCKKINDTTQRAFIAPVLIIMRCNRISDFKA